MPIRPSQPPAASREELARSLRQISAASPHISMAADAAEAGGAPLLRFAHQAYTLTPDDLRAYSGAETAKARSWRYLVPSPEGDAIAEVADEGTGGHRFTELTAGLHSQLSRESLEWISSEAELGDDTFEVRALRLPALLLDAIWLKNLSGGDDRFAVVRSFHGALEPKRLYPASDFFSVLRRLAESVTFDNSPEAGQGER
jgi:hypothetical protein